MTDLDRLALAVRDNPADWDLRRVYADCLEEHGEAVMANGQRWQAKKRKYPWQIMLDDYAWYANHARVHSTYRLSSRLLDEMHRLHAASLPPHVKRAERPPKGWEGFFAHHSIGPYYAESILARALHSLNIVVRGDE